jgi:hypothetical protein|tara:strand:+ start:2198 stop:2377 length:180 start_codon:yes stop_codon:yes gene_type:complete
MIHRICDTCGKTESVDFMVAIDDNIYCTECDEENQKAEDNGMHRDDCHIRDLDLGWITI